MTKEGYQPIKTKKTIKIIPPNTGSNVRINTWEDLNRSYWEGFDNAKNKMEKRIAELKKENAELKALIKSEHEIEARKNNSLVSQVTKAKEIIKELLKALDGRSGFNEDVFKQAEQFLEEKKGEI